MARIIERWAERYELPKDLVAQLTSHVDDQFWAGLLHLEAGRLFSELGFAVDFMARIGGKTPDLLIERRDLKSMVEVFVATPSADDRTELEVLNDIRTFIRDEVGLPNGNLSISPMRPLREMPTRQALEQMKTSLLGAISGEPSSIRINVGGAEFHGFFAPMESLNPPAVYVSPAGGALNEAPRVYARLGEKLSRYGPLVTPELGLILVVASVNWKLTAEGLAEALYGSEQITIDRATGSVSDPAYSGLGAAVVGGQVGYDEAAKLWGTLYLKRGFIDEELGLARPDATFLYNPFAELPLAPDTFAPLPEQQVQGSGLLWVRRDSPPLSLN